MTEEKKVKIRYIGEYDGKYELLDHPVVYGDVEIVSEEVANTLLSTGKWQKLREFRNAGGE